MSSSRSSLRSTSGSSLRRRPIAHAAPAALLCALLAACSSSESNAARKAAADSLVSALQNVQDTLHPFGQAAASKPSSGPPTGKIRVVNLIYLGDKPAGALDLYDVNRPDSAAKPIITNLAFGQVSAYVTPRSPSNYPGVPSNLYMFPAGSRTVALPYGAVENSGFTQGDQVTVVLGPSSMGANGISRFDVAEEGKRIVKERQDAQHVIPAGQALVLVRDADQSIVTSLPERYIMIDGSCRQPADGPQYMPGTEGRYPLTPGAHTLRVVSAIKGKALVKCSGGTLGATTTLTVQAGQRYLALMTGLESDGFKVVTAAIDAP
ncbi:MAG: hypothetical protein ACREOJ_10525 [Gemmatimonadaceae bacterium]